MKTLTFTKESADFTFVLELFMSLFNFRFIVSLILKTIMIYFTN